MARIVPDLLEERAAEHPERPALRVKRGGEWQTTTWRGYRDAARRFGRALLQLGVEPGKGVAILSYNRPEWFVADQGAIAAGALPVGIYTNLTAEQIAYVARHSESRVAVVENREQLDKFLAVRGELPELATLVLLDGASDAPGVIGWEELMALGDGVPEADLDERLAAQRPDDTCTLIYTSGTTGAPKGVMLTHQNFVWTAAAVCGEFTLGADDVVISYLPLAHSAEQMVSLYIPLTRGLCTAFAESLEKIGENLREVRPQLFFAVPRVWEKIQAAIVEAGAKNPPLKKKIAAWARKVGLESGYADQRGEKRPWTYPIADKLVFSKVRERLGLDRALICATGAAPISLDTAEFFLSLGIPIMECYGLTETSAPATVSVPGRYRTGAAGYVLPGSEIRAAPDGELFIRGPHVFKGYSKEPAATREVLSDDGWFATGDVGVVDEQGFVRITDRKKEILVTSGGKNVAPQAIEAKLKAISGVEQAVVIGDRRNYLTALLTVEPGQAAAALAAAGEEAPSDPAALAAHPALRRHLEAEVERVNATLARYEQIKRFAVLPGPFSVEGGELTPTLKLKRRVIHDKHAGEIEALYA
ncbi:MAG TPA: AMP-binding protein [Thermoanaerobaculia bacterium]|nr:AMP-binding protein [Thermoanaerobaculia bacterium]